MPSSSTVVCGAGAGTSRTACRCGSQESSRWPSLDAQSHIGRRRTYTGPSGQRRDEGHRVRAAGEGGAFAFGTGVHLLDQAAQRAIGGSQRLAAAERLVLAPPARKSEPHALRQGGEQHAEDDQGHDDLEQGEAGLRLRRGTPAHEFAPSAARRVSSVVPRGPCGPSQLSVMRTS